MKTKATLPKKEKEFDVEELHEIFMKSPDVQRLLAESNKVLSKVKFPPNFFNKSKATL